MGGGAGSPEGDPEGDWGGSRGKSKDSDAVGRRRGGVVWRQSPRNSQGETMTK